MICLEFRFGRLVSTSSQIGGSAQHALAKVSADIAAAIRADAGGKP